MGCQAQLVNVLGLIRSEEGGDAWKQSIAYPFEQMRRLARGQILQVVATGDRYDTARFGGVPVVDATATFHPDDGTAAIFVANRSQTETAQLDVDCRGLPVGRVVAATVLRAPDGAAPDLTNHDRHDAIVPQPLTGAEFDQQILRADLPPLSWTVFELARPEA